MTARPAAPHNGTCHAHVFTRCADRRSTGVALSLSALLLAVITRLGVPWRSLAAAPSLAASRRSKYRIFGEVVPVAVERLWAQTHVPNVGSWADEAPLADTAAVGTRSGSTYA